MMTRTDPIPSDTEAPARRRFLRGGSAALAAVAAGGMTLATTPASAQAINDPALLNYFLNLGYLQAEFFSRAVNGYGLSSTNTGGASAGNVTGGSAVPFQTTSIQQYATEISADRIAQVQYLRSVLGSGSAVAEPNIDLVNSFVALGYLVGMANFNPFTNETSFLLGAFFIEDVVVTALRGALPLLQNRTLLGATAGLLAAISHQAGLIRALLYSMGSGNATVSFSGVRSSLSGAADDQGVVLNNMANVVATDANGLVFARTSRQVLNIFYGAQNATSGLFFPNGLNGTIR